MGSDEPAGCAAGFEFVEGATSDLAFEARGDSLEAVFTAAAEALLAATVEHPDAVRRSERHSMRLEEPDLELLLMRFMNELVFLRDARGLLLHPAHLSVHVDGDASLDAELEGETIELARHALACDVKAATAHGLSVARAPSGGWSASVTLDV